MIAWRRAGAGVALAWALGVPAVAGAMDDGELRRGVRDAGLVTYMRFKPAADFSYPDVATGQARSLGDFRGRVVLVNVWATWCPPCVKEMPSLQRLHDEFQERGLVVLGVNVRDKKNAAAVSKWLADRRLTFVNVKATDDGPKFPSGFTIPQTFLIDREGRLIANKPGSRDWAGAEIRALIGRVLDDSREAR